jgi:hypothetical protein
MLSHRDALALVREQGPVDRERHERRLQRQPGQERVAQSPNARHFSSAEQGPVGTAII